MKITPQGRILAFVLAMALQGARADVPTPEPRFATKEEYLGCLVARATIEEKQSRLAESERKYKERAVKFQAAEADLAAQVKRHFPSTKHEIESYNKAMAARNASVQSLNGEARSLDQEQAVVNKLVVEANLQCGGMLVSPEVAQAAEEEHRKGSTSP